MKINFNCAWLLVFASISALAIDSTIPDPAINCLQYNGGRGPRGPQELERYKALAISTINKASNRVKGSRYEKIYYAIQNAEFTHGTDSVCLALGPHATSQTPAAYILPGQCKIFFCYRKIQEYRYLAYHDDFVLHIILHEANHLTGDYGAIENECSSDRFAREILMYAGRTIYPSGYDGACHLNIPWQK